MSPLPASPTTAPALMSFLDPYSANRRISLLTGLRVLLWGLILGGAWLLWLWLS